MCKRRGFTPLETAISNRGSKRFLTGFTLVELLIVIAIIALLMAIMMPALQKVREQGKAAVCQSNLRQIGTGAALYADYYASYVPRGAAGRTREAWYQLFMPFLAQKAINKDYCNVEIYRCPSYPDKAQTVCYVVNGWAFNSKNDMTGYEIRDPTKLMPIRHRASTIYLADNEHGSWRPIIKRTDDAGTDLCDVWHPGHMPLSNSQDRNRGRRIARARHREGGNCLYLDWHVEWVAADKMTIDMWRFHK